MFDKITDTLKGLADRILIGYEQNKPDILIYGGAAGLVVAGVLACVETVKAHKDLAEAKETLDIIDEAREKGVTRSGEAYSEEDAKHDKAVVSRNTVLKVCSRYIVPAGIIVLSAKSIHDGVSEGNRRLTSLGLELAAATARTDKILERAVKNYGPDAKDKLLYDIHTETTEEKETDENGKEKTVIKEKVYAGEDISGGLRIVLNENTCNWFMKGYQEYNFAQLEAFQATLNNDLARLGGKFGGSVMTAADIMRRIGYKPAESYEWQLKHKDEGFIYTPENNCVIDFGLDEAHRLCDFNVCDWKEEIILHINFRKNIWAKG